ncbi:MAG: hypothetical protein HC923_03025 [Myxococcales bacterium]|nr:hypothetical protein [Myxococcales bacterium]
MAIHKGIPPGSGIGSSASSAVAAVVAINELLGRPLSRRELLPFALEGEASASAGAIHADNGRPLSVRRHGPRAEQRGPRYRLVAGP